MDKKTKFIVEEVFTSNDIEIRRETFQKIVVNIITKQQLHKSA